MENKKVDHFSEFGALVNSSIRKGYPEINAGDCLFEDDVEEKQNGLPIFRTNLKMLINPWELYINSFDMSIRQLYNCNTCRSFINRYSDLVYLKPDGSIVPVFWNISDEELSTLDQSRGFVQFCKSISEYFKAVKITERFITSSKHLGLADKGGWDHFGYETPYWAWSDTPGKDIGVFSDLFKSLVITLSNYKIEDIDKALNVFELKIIQPRKNFIDTLKVVKELMSVTGDRKSNIQKYLLSQTNAAVAGFNNSMVQTLVDDLKAGKDFDYIKRTFENRSSSLNYLRAKTSAKSENIKKAEQYFKDNDLGPSLQRRMAYLDEVETIWKPEETAVETEGIFGKLDNASKTEENVTETNQTLRITTSKFLKEILPNVVEMSYVNMKNDDGAIIDNRYCYFMSLTTAAVPDSKPIYRYDKMEERNQFSPYCFNEPVPRSFMNVETGDLNIIAIVNKVMGDLTLSIAVIENAHDVRHEQSAIFPELLIPELHEYRSVIEEYSGKTPLPKPTKQVVCGPTLSQGVVIKTRLKSGLVVNYNIFEE